MDRQSAITIAGLLLLTLLLQAVPVAAADSGPDPYPSLVLPLQGTVRPVYIGDAVAVTAQVRNRGGADAMDVQVNFTRLHGGASLLLWTSRLPRVPGNDTAAPEVSYRWDTSGLEPGLYRFSVRAGSTSLDSGEFYLHDPQDAVVVDAAVPLSDALVAGEESGVRVALFNRGPLPLSGWTASLILDGMTLLNSTVLDIGSGGTFSTVIGWSAAGLEAGVHTLSVVSGRSSVSARVAVLLPADAVVLADAAAPLNGTVGIPVPVSAVLHNPSTVPAGGVGVNMYQDGVFLRQFRTDVPAGGIATVSTFWTPPPPAIPGTVQAYMLTFTAAGRTKSVMVLASPLPPPAQPLPEPYGQLRVNVAKTTLVQSEMVNLLARLKLWAVVGNNGSVPAPLLDVLILDNTDVVYSSILFLQSSELKSIDLSYYLPNLVRFFGTHNLMLTINGTVQAQLNLTVLEDPRPRLDISGFRLSNDQPLDGEILTLNVTVANTGGLDATGVRLFFRDGTRTLTELTIAHIPAGGQKDVLLTWRAERGEHRLGVEMEGYPALKFVTVTVYQIVDPLVVVLFLAGVAGVAGFWVYRNRRRAERRRGARRTVSSPEERAAHLKERLAEAKRMGIEVGDIEDKLGNGGGDKNGG